MRKWILILFFMLTVVPAASAQTGKRVAVGLGLTWHSYTDGGLSPRHNPSPTFDYRISLSRTPRQGWKWEPKGGFSWFRAETDTPIAGTETRLGRLRAMPFMGGIERAYRTGPTKLGFSIVGGPSFNRFTISDDARGAYAGLGQNLTDVKVTKTSIAIRPELSYWYDLNRWIALHASANYVFDRPTLETTVSGTTISEKVTADHFNFHVSFVVGVF